MAPGCGLIPPQNYVPRIPPPSVLLLQQRKVLLYRRERWRPAVCGLHQRILSCESHLQECKIPLCRWEKFSIPLQNYVRRIPTPSTLLLPERKTPLYYWAKFHIWKRMITMYSILHLRHQHAVLPRKVLYSVIFQEKVPGFKNTLLLLKS